MRGAVRVRLGWEKRISHTPAEFLTLALAFTLGLLR